MDKTVNVLLVGVGGQGILLASEVISRAGMLAGLDVKKSEVHGMAQRGGSVVSHVRIGPKVYSPLISEGEADYILSFEILEAVRYATWLREGGWALISTQNITPVTVSSGQQTGVGDIDERIEAAYPNRQLIDAVEIAAEAGNSKAANIVITGALSWLLSDIDEQYWRQAISELVPSRHLDVNIRAFQAGRDVMRSEPAAVGG